MIPGAFAHVRAVYVTLIAFASCKVTVAAGDFVFVNNVAADCANSPTATYGLIGILILFTEFIS